MTQLTVLGGGQLGRMLALAGIPLGVSFRFLDPSPEAPAGVLGTLVVGDLDDLAAATRAAAGANVVTYEWEGVPAATARHLAAIAPVWPSPRALEVAQDRLAEKEACSGLGIGTAPYRAARTRPDLDDAVHGLGFPAVCKTRRGGYDGKGQVVVRDHHDVDAAWERLGGVPLLVEAFVPFERELSIVAVRTQEGDVHFWPVVENEHTEGILRVTLAPARGWDTTLQLRAESCIAPLLEELRYVGVCCVELFETGEALLANEIAPRVHNSGHWTIEGAHTSQFENHVRAVLGWPLGPTVARGFAAMVNCIGSMPEREAVMRIPGAHWHDYGKAARPGRKVGHVTVVAATDGERDEKLDRLRQIVRD